MTAVTVMTQAVRANRRMEVLGSSEISTLSTIQPPNSMNPLQNSVANAGRLSRIARVTISTASMPNVR